MDNLKLSPIYIGGPTASGKSDLALQLADEFDSVIISADSMQIYKGLDIGTAKVSREIRNKYEHKMIDIVDYDAEFSVAQYAELAKIEIASAINRNKLPIIVGGTGLYFEALLYPMSFGNTVKNESLRAELLGEYERFGALEMHSRLRMLDSETADRLHPNDIKRVIRALEIVIATGKTLKENGDNAEKSLSDIIMVSLNTDRDKLYERINGRVDKMFDDGLIDEVLSIGRFDCQSMQAIGYKEFSDCEFIVKDNKFVLTEIEEERIKALIKQHSRNYAKRQITWFKKYNFNKWFECGEKRGAIEYIKAKLSN